MLSTGIANICKQLLTTTIGIALVVRLVYWNAVNSSVMSVPVPSSDFQGKWNALLVCTDSLFLYTHTRIFIPLQNNFDSFVLIVVLMMKKINI